MSNVPTDSETADAMAFAMDALQRMPRRDKATSEAYMTAVLIVFWGALWGTFGTEFAKGFIEAQLRGMEGNADVFTPVSECH